MNLVAKEFVSARDDERGVLILSEFAGAARELTAAVHINPFSLDGCADALADALSMRMEEQMTRMRAMREVVERFNAYRWAADILSDAAQLRDHATPASGQAGHVDRSAERHSLNGSSGVDDVCTTAAQAALRRRLSPLPKRDSGRTHPGRAHRGPDAPRGTRHTASA